MASSALLSHDDNVGSAPSDNRKIADSSAAARISLLEVTPFSEGFSVATGADASGHVFDRLSGLNDAALEADLSLRKKWGFGAFVPWARAAISVGRDDFADGYRNANLYRAAIEFGERFDERWNLWGEYSLDRRRAVPLQSDLRGVASDAFNESGRSFKLAVQYALSERASLSLGSLLRHGDVVTTTTAGTYIFANSKAVAPDPTFGPGAYAYRLNGATFSARLSAEYSLSAHNLIGCGFQRSQTHAQGGNNYTDSIEELTWNYRF